MQDSVLTLGEKIVLAARLAAIEHVRQELDAVEASGHAAATVGDRGFTDEPDAPALTRPVETLLAEYFGGIDLKPKSRRRASRSPRKEAA